MQWFRMYSEFATDPKVQSMSETLQRRFTMFLCLHCSGEYEQLNDEELAFALRITAEELHQTRETFKQKGFLDAEGKIRNWNKRQYKSDSSAERVRKYREKKVKRSCNVTVTPSETDTEADTESEKKVPSEPVELRSTNGAPKPKPPKNIPAERVFQHWRETHRHPHAKLDEKRQRLIARALKHYSEADLCRSISGYLNSPHHMGQNESGAVYDSLELMLRDSEHVDRGLKCYESPPRTDLSPLTRRNVAAIADWQPPEMRNVAK